MEFSRLVGRFMEQERMHTLEGSRGVRNLAKLVNALGYEDSINRYGQQPGGYCLGDIFAFLEDNSGAVEAVIEWVKSRNAPEWQEELEGQMELEIDEEIDPVDGSFIADPDRI